MLTKIEIQKAIETLTRSQGFYGRILKALDNNDELLDKLVDKGFKDVVDLVMYLEC